MCANRSRSRAGPSYDENGTRRRLGPSLPPSRQRLDIAPFRPHRKPAALEPRTGLNQSQDSPVHAIATTKKKKKVTKRKTKKHYAKRSHGKKKVVSRKKRKPAAKSADAGSRGTLIWASDPAIRRPHCSSARLEHDCVCSVEPAPTRPTFLGWRLSRRKLVLRRRAGYAGPKSPGATQRRSTTSSTWRSRTRSRRAIQSRLVAPPAPSHRRGQSIGRRPSSTVEEPSASIRGSLSKYPDPWRRRRAPG